MIKHRANCTANYPEKIKGEAAQATTIIDIGNGEQVVQCNDCGAFEIVEKKRDDILCIAYGRLGELPKLWKPGDPIPKELLP